VGTRYQGITRAVYGSEACCKTAGLTAFSNTDLNRTLYLVKFSEKIPGRFVENQQKQLFFDYFKKYGWWAACVTDWNVFKATGGKSVCFLRKAEKLKRHTRARTG
jgi:hypothetical protein